jgi:chromosome segregation ATPase
MTLLTDTEDTGGSAVASTRAKMHMLVQMAQALEDEAGGLYRRAAGYEEEEFLLDREIEDRQTEINRLSLKLYGLRADREALLARIDELMDEALALRETVYADEEAQALAAIERGCAPEAAPDGDAMAEDAGPQPNYFRRAELGEAVR